MKYERLTTNNVQSNLQSLLNYAYSKDGEVYLRYANGEEDKRLAEYIAALATEKGCERTADDVIEDGCVECDCEVAILNAVSIQAAELRHRLAELEDKIESGTLVDLPCKLGQVIYTVYDGAIHEYFAEEVNVHEDGRFIFETPTLFPKRLVFGKEVFTDKSKAEARLKELQNEG